MAIKMELWKVKSSLKLLDVSVNITTRIGPENRNFFTKCTRFS